MNTAIWEGIGNNLKIEIVLFVVNTNNKFIVYNSYIEIQNLIPFIKVLLSTYLVIVSQSC